jgi:peptidoglycan hydrolase-like protein with peptidoglycan-binding domain
MAFAQFRAFWGTGTTLDLLLRASGTGPMNQLSQLEVGLMVFSSLSDRFRRRRAGRVVAVTVVLSLSPVTLFAGSLAAEGSVAGVTGLAQGAQGEAVRAVQQALINQGISVAGGADGVFGSGTASALKQFQARNGLNATGVVDAATALALGLTSSPLLGLSQGARGEGVRQLQQRLIEIGIPVAGGADGVFGPGTTAAVKEFQGRKGYSKTGVVNAATVVALGAATTAATPAAPAPAAAPASSMSGLKMGARGDAVKQLQQQLIAAGFSMVGGADGVFGALTANALGSFQQSVGLPVTRVADDATLAALAQAVANPGSAPGAASPLLGLKVGARGDAVRRLQQTLIDAGVSVKGGADGVFGWNTQVALKQYQKAVGLAQSGEVDEPTASALASGKSIAGGPSGLVGLKAGSLGSAVKALQEALIKAGVNVKGGADGIFGPATAQALKSFQTSQGLPATGVVDDATVAALQNPKAPTTPTTNPTDGYAVFGEKGARVMALQAALIKAGVQVKGGVDGDFGSGTSAAIMDFQRLKGLNITGKVNEATANALGLAKMPAPAPPDPASVKLEVFPVQGKCYFGDSFGYSRSAGRVHLGVDIIAPAGKLIYAVTGGRITKIYADYPGSLSGNGVRLTAPDGTYYFYAHMTGIGPGIALGVPVKAGQILGTVGSTGSSGTNHLHLEIHPKGGSAINPYPFVKAIDACNVTEPRPQP